MIGIYTITSPTGRVYVGQSRRINRRISQYKHGLAKGQPKLYNSLKKHGWDAHKFEVIMELREDIKQEWLDYWEQFFMDYYRGEGYELMNTREGGLVNTHSKETRIKIGNVHRGKTVSEEVRRKIGISLKIVFAKPEIKEKMILSHLGKPSPMKGKKRSPDFCEKVKKGKAVNPGIGMSGKKHSVETKIKIASNRKGKRCGENHPFYGRQHSKEVINKISKSKMKPILQFTKDEILIKEYPSYSDAFLRTGINHITSCALGNRKTAGGFKWKYKIKNNE